jgi:hypothetical protein
MNQANIPALEPALELGARQAVRFDDFPRDIGHSQLGHFWQDQRQ